MYCSFEQRFGVLSSRFIRMVVVYLSALSLGLIISLFLIPSASARHSPGGRLFFGLINGISRT